MTTTPLDLEPILQRMRELDNAWDPEYCAPTGPAKAIASAEDVPHLITEIEQLRAECVTMLALIRDLTDEDDCWFDHHGGCQAHGYLSLEPGQQCPHQEAKKLIAANSEAAS